MYNIIAEMHAVQLIHLRPGQLKNYNAHNKAIMRDYASLCEIVSIEHRAYNTWR